MPVPQPTAFEALKRLGGLDPRWTEHTGAEAPRDAVSDWAGLQGLAYHNPKDRSFALAGSTAGKRWKLECGKPTRDFIHGKELLARAALDVPHDAAVLIINRPLKEMLETRAYNLYTESLQTAVDQSLPVEMRWLAIYQEMGWSGLPAAFWDRYAVVADHRVHASAWVTPALAGMLLSWPEPATAAEVPFILLLRRGKAYLRMQYTPADLPTLEHAAVVFTTACDAAVAGFSADILV
ncbi:MAG: hypothetical protein JWQ72_2197 [Polaromonas sp.]|nr:hypothetical protein [Polaromonas sp.]